MESSPHETRNLLLSGMSTADRNRLLPALEWVTLELRETLEKPGQTISHAHFVDSGLVSILGNAAPGHRIEVGMVGFEGMTGIGALLGDDHATTEAFVQTAGAAWRVPVEVLREAMDASPELRALLLRFVHVFMVQCSQTALANGRGRLSERLARWLLMWQDRLQDQKLPITHEFVALLLGVRRQGVTVALHELEGMGLIRATNSRVRILDREGLKREANGFYGVPEAEYGRVFGAPAV